MLFIHLAPLVSAAPPQLRLATFGVGDTLLIVVLALIVFGPKRLPEISRQVGKLLYEFRKASNDFKFQIEEELRVAEQAERQKQLQAAATPQPATPVALSADAAVSAAPAETGSPAATEAGPSILPPSTGAPVSTRPPFRGADAGAALMAAEAAPVEELEANAQAALQAAAAEQAAAQHAGETEREEGAASRPVPTHHG